LLWAAYWRLIVRQRASDVKTDMMQTRIGRACIVIILILALAAVAYMLVREATDDYYEYRIIHDHSRIVVDPADSI
jgi:hypothetical protein